MWVLLKLPRFEGANYAGNYDNRSRHRQIGVSSPRHRRRRQCDYPPATEASLCLVILPEAASVCCRSRGLRLVPSLVARVAGTGSHSTPDATCVCEALRQTTEERCHGRGGDLRSCEAADNAVR